MMGNEKTALGVGSTEDGTEIAEQRGTNDSHTKHDTTGAPLMQAGIERLLLRGEANALTAAELARLTGQSTRDITLAVRRARLEGKPVCSSGAGFFLAADAAELARCVRGLDRRLAEITKTRDAMNAMLTEVDDGGQS